MACAPSEDSDQPGHPSSLIRAFAVRSLGSWGPMVSLCGQRRLWSDWADVQADLSLRWAHRLFCWFCRAATQIYFQVKLTLMPSVPKFGTWQLVQTQIKRRLIRVYTVCFIVINGPRQANLVLIAYASAQSRQNLRCSLIQAVCQEEPSDRKPDPWSLWMAGHAQLKFVMTECSKTQIRLTGLNYKVMSTNIRNKLNEPDTP